MHKESIIVSNNKVNAEKALVMLHGRGGSAENILSLASQLHVDDYALFAPQATHHSWYPHSFLVQPKENEPSLSLALALVDKTVELILEKGLSRKQVYFVGFSQGACLMLEYLARNATRYGGAAAFTGGLIGDRIYCENYAGDFDGTPIFIGTSNTDFHVPVSRVYATTKVLKAMGADVTEKVYDNMEHTIIQDEIDQANKLIFN